MPMYAFRCGKCGHEYEELVRQFGQAVPCPKCGSAEVERMVSAPAARVGQRLQSRLADRGSGCSAPPGSGFG